MANESIIKEFWQFLKFRTNEEGRLEMMLPEHPGFLRIDRPSTQLLEIRIKHED